ncbi:MAG: hypothetical protein GTN76_08005 [Candidatus Aenigmarchaeota archaeon]|nr:hypothetical protein [Candidatus Aenigmarchaeota archaeon]
MNILGISCYYHDSAACLIKDGKVAAAAHEERFSRIKHDEDFPINAINYCLSEGGISIEDVDYIGFYEKPILKFDRVLSQYLETFPRSFGMFIKTMPSWLTEKLKVPSIIRKKLKYEGDILFIEHHLAHAASAYMVSPFKKAAILTIDAIGEWTSTSLGLGEGNEITLLKEIRFPHSIGLFYSTITAYLGFRVNNDEYKVMGLSAYGKPTYYERFKEIIDIKEDGSFRLDMSYFDYHRRFQMPSKKFTEEFGSARIPESKIEQKHMDIAASLQKITEEILFKMLNHLYDLTKTDNLCMAGGVALNSVANGKITKNTPFKKVYVQPASTDAGTSMGVAFFIHNSILGKDRKYVLNSAFLGPSFSEDQIREFLDKNNIPYQEFKDDKDLARKTAELIHKDKIIGWFQGRMEWGPRALGNRSILANPCNPNTKDILNRKVKHREWFRPFAPVVPLEDAKRYFDTDMPVPYMTMVYPVKEEKRKFLPSITHVDGSGRLQTIERERNSLYYDVIREFEKLSGFPVVINTSFNVRGEPIVCSPEDAYNCFKGTGIDHLVMGKFLISKI